MALRAGVPESVFWVVAAAIDADRITIAGGYPALVVGFRSARIIEPAHPLEASFAAAHASIARLLDCCGGGPVEYIVE